MILLRSDCLVFKMSTGETVPCSVETLTEELLGETGEQLDPELIHQAAHAVVHYFKAELQRSSVSVNEFSEALARVLRGFGFKVKIVDGTEETHSYPISNLHDLAKESGKGFELAFFQRLREEMKLQLEQHQDLIRFVGLKYCAKALCGARRWCPRCQNMSDRIVDFLRDCLWNETSRDVSLFVN